MKRNTVTLTNETLNTMLAAAWRIIWEDNTRKEAAGEDFRGDTRFTTASDLENQVRSFVHERLTGLELGSTGRAWGYCYWGERIRLADYHGSLLDAARDWLLGEVRRGRIQVHNFGRGHVSGARFRPLGVEPSAAEQRTLAENAKPQESRPVHYRDPEVRGYPSYTLCSRAQREANRGSRFSSYRRSYTRMTDERAKVTCPRCLKLLGA